MKISNLAKLYKVNKHTIEYLIRLLDRHGEEVLRKRKNRYYSPELKLEIINKVSMEHCSINETAIEYRLLNTETLYNGMKSYKENGYTVVEK
ncbi:MAG: transposase [Faecalicoccus sp.]|uniref:transposase n=1 Tax=Faecalicoccus sp. TaxID=1971758 RepID=UPI002A91C5BA|nr:transposase [Faecalicoccus sp.]MDY5232102.1 transposase [Faecalicoccus sp.]